MDYWASWFGTPTEKKREQYLALYEDLKSYYEQFEKKLKVMENKIEQYESSKPMMGTASIPEDVFSDSDKSVHGKVMTVGIQQWNNKQSLSRAVEAAYTRYRHYANLAEQERLEREAAKRREAERRKREAEERKRR